MKSNWRVYTKKADFKAIGERFGIDQVMARIIRNRGLETDEQINMYLNGTVDDMHSPHLLKDADKCVDILTDKIQAGKKIHIIGDYDIDGICSTTILYKGLKADLNKLSQNQKTILSRKMELERLMNPLVTQKHMIDLILSNPFQAHENKEEKLCQDPNETIC